MMFNASVRRVNHGRLLIRRFVVTDFSFALITACLGAFNGGMQLDRYLRLTYQLMQKTSTGRDADSITVLCLCAAHMLKMLSMRIRRKESRKEVRKLTLTYFGALQRTTTLTAAGDIYHHICVVLTSRLETRQVSDARLHLTAAVSGVSADADDSDDDVVDNVQQADDSVHTADFRSLRENSPFCGYFRQRVADVCDTHEDTALSSECRIRNPTYSPNCFDVVADVMPFFPL